MKPWRGRSQKREIRHIPYSKSLKKKKRDLSEHMILPSDKNGTTSHVLTGGKRDQLRHMDILGLLIKV
jgi:hypothetical protein